MWATTCWVIASSGTGTHPSTPSCAAPIAGTYIRATLNRICTETHAIDDGDGLCFRRFDRIRWGGPTQRRAAHPTPKTQPRVVRRRTRRTKGRGSNDNGPTDHRRR